MDALEPFDGELGALLRHLRAENRSPKTIEGYEAAAVQLWGFFVSSGMPRLPRDIKREHIEHFLIHLREDGRSDSTVETRFRGLQQFFRSCSRRT